MSLAMPMKKYFKINSKIGDSIFITGPLGEGRKGLADWNRKKVTIR